MGENVNKLKKLSRMDLTLMAIGQVIGVGVVTMTGIGIGFTGRSVNLAYLVAGIITIISALPQIYIGATANFKGGQYSQVSVLIGKKAAGIYMYITLFLGLAISMYAIYFAQYFISLVPNANIAFISIIVLVILFGINLMGVKEAATLQNTMVIVLALSLTLYIVSGIGSIQADFFTDGFFTNGVSSFILASVYLTFAAGGATFIVNFSNDAKNPTSDIPFAIIISTAGVVLLYALMATIAAGVLPVELVANQPLSVSANAIMSKPLAAFFIIGGAMFALLTTLNFCIGMMVNPLKLAAKDGWLPKAFMKTNKRFGTSHYILLVLFLIGVIPILIGLDLSQVANSTVVLTMSLRGFIALAAMRLPTVLPELWNKSKLNVTNRTLNIICIFSIAMTVVSVLLLIVTGSKMQIIFNIVILAICLLAALLRGKKATNSPEYE